MNRAEREEFLHTLSPHAQAAQRQTGIPAAVALAQAAWESGWNSSGLALNANNLFGIKAGSRWTGPVYNGSTWEIYGGQRVEFKGDGRIYTDKDEALAAGAHSESLFRFFTTPEDGFLEHNRVFYNGAYEPALPYRSKPYIFINLAGPRYATDVGYVSNISLLMKGYGLTSYDVPPEQWHLNPEYVPELWIKAWRKYYPAPPEPGLVLD